ncbi:hypothetical protein KC333_g1371 [Hortaea werneckii]|nr:hypothetical protein KC333_g1371 [Hortaea werneckii]KAI7323680.1 hypothetical protein KC326_g1417 [Hortaea werneckii]
MKQKKFPASHSMSKYAKREVSQNSRLLDLPPELRNSIYTYVLATDDVIQIPASGKRTRPPLLQVCQQITADATLLYYSCNKFNISAGKRLKILRRWILSLEEKERKCLGTVTVTREVNDKTAVMVARFATEIMQTDDRKKQAELLDSARQRETEDVHASRQTFTALSVLGLNPERVQFDPPPGPDPHALITQAYGLHGEQLNENLSRCVKRLLNDRWVEFMRRNGNHASSVLLSCESVAGLRSKGYNDREIFGRLTRVRREGVE